MTAPNVLTGIPGAQEFIEWFGVWPSFHDAEVISFSFSRDSRSTLEIHVFQMTSAVTDSGHYNTEKHAIVSLSTSEVLNGSLNGFNHQNVIFGLTIEQTNIGFSITLDPCYGLAGNLQVKDLQITFQPGIPAHGVYSKTR